jgi:tetratricopeptide (TPR) repeat protein
VEEEGRGELANDLASAIMNRGTALSDLGRLSEALAAYDEASALIADTRGPGLRRLLATSCAVLARRMLMRGRIIGAWRAFRKAMGLFGEALEPGDS